MTSALLSEALAPLRQNPPRTAVMFDIDGTLAPIVDHASGAHVPESTRQLLGHIQSMNARYGKSGSVTWIIGGDFNTSPDEPRFAKEKTIPALLASGFSWAWQGLPPSSRITMPTDLRYPPAAFDHIFYRNATLSRAWVAPTSSQSSDHRAVNIVLEVR